MSFESNIIYVQVTPISFLKFMEHMGTFFKHQTKVRPCGFTAFFTSKHKGWCCLLHCGIYPIESIAIFYIYLPTSWLMLIVNVWYIYRSCQYVNIPVSIPDRSLHPTNFEFLPPKRCCWFNGGKTASSLGLDPARQAREFGLWWYNNLTSFNGWLGLGTP